GRGACTMGMAPGLHGLHEREGRVVSVVGWSVGGIYARELARRFPAEVRQVVTLASPFRDPSAPAVARLMGGPPRGPGERANLGAPLPVPATSILSRSDGIVAWRSCLEDAGPGRESGSGAD